MISLIGIVIVLGAIAGGYLMEHGKLLVLFQPAELLIIFGSAVGTVVVANPPTDADSNRGGLGRGGGGQSVHERLLHR